MIPARSLAGVLAAALLLVTAVQPAAAADRKDAGRAAFVKSLLVPGWGQYSLGQTNSAITFFGAELALIGGIYTLRSYGKSAEDDYRALAAAHAGVRGDHDHDFFVDVGNWMNTDQFNERRLQERSYDALYREEADQWRWDSDANRRRMRQIRINSDRAFNSVIYLVGGIVLNHVASGIHAGRGAVRRADTSQAQRDWNLGLGPATEMSGVRVSYSHSF